MKRFFRPFAALGATAVLLVTGVGWPAASGADTGPINPDPGSYFGPIEGALLSLWPNGLTIPADLRPVLLPKFTGGAASPKRITNPAPPADPQLLSSQSSNLNSDAYRSNTTPDPGPLGRQTTSTSTWLGDRECTSETVLSASRLIAVCYSVTGPYILELDPHTLHRLSVFQMPARNELTTSPEDFRPQLTGAGYFYLTKTGQLVMPTATNEIFVLSTGSDQHPDVHLVTRYPIQLASGDKLLSAIPSWNGTIWFESRSGIVGTINPGTGAVQQLPLGETIDNAPSTDPQGGVYVVTTAALYRLDATRAGRPVITWRQGYPNDGQVTLPQATAGSGTSPTLLDTPTGHYVAITDNKNPIDVRVYRRDNPAGRLTCSVPVFSANASATATAMIGTGNSLVVTNQYGYHGPGQTLDGIADILLGRLSQPGMTRIDVDATGCHTVWTSTARIASGVPKLSTTTGLIYAPQRELGQPVQDVWYLDAIDFRTGKIVWQYQYGSGVTANPNYAAVNLGPDGSVYVGGLLGLFRIWDSR